MVRTSLLILSVLLVAIFIGCNKTETGNSNMAAENSNKSMTSAPTNASTTTASTGEKIGVPECDDYVAKYESCLRSKVPEAMKASLESSLKTARENWKKSAENPQAKATLAAACKQAKEAAAASMKNFGCTF